MSFILPLSLGSFQLGHHKIVTYGKHKYSFVPHSHAILHIFSFWTFLFFWVLLMPFFLNFIQAPLSIVSFCVRDVFLFLAHGRRRNFGNFILIWFSTLFWYILLSLGVFWLLLAFWLQILGMGLFIYNILFTLLPSHGSFVVTS